MTNRKRTAVWLLTFLLPAWAPAADQAANAPGDPNAPGHPFQPGQRVVFLGDSITQDGRYVAFVQAYFWAKYPKLDLEIINLGLSAETVNGATEPGSRSPRPYLFERLDRALEAGKGKWVFVCYGMNDGIYRPPSLEVLGSYTAGLRRLIAKVRRTGAKAVLLTPPPFDSETKRQQRRKLVPAGQDGYTYGTPYENYDDVLEAFAAFVRGLGGEEGVERVIDLHAPVKRYVRQTRQKAGKYIYGDGVHPPIDGHLAMALAILDGLGEDAAAAEKLLTKLTGVALYPPAADKPQPAQADLLKAVLQRHGALSAAYRAHSRGDARGKPLPEAVEAAGKQAEDIRRRIAELMPPEPATRPAAP